MSYLHKPHTRPLEQRTPFQLVQVHANAHPNKEAFVFRDTNKNRTTLTYKEYETKSKLLAAAFLEMGLKHGDKVLVMLPSCLEFVLIHMALSRIGANMMFLEEDAFIAVLAIDNLACVIARNELEIPCTKHDKVLQNIQIALDENKLKSVLIVSPSAGPLQDHQKVFIYKELFQMAQRTSDWQDAVHQAENAVQMDDPTFILFTSGTTSIPKPIQYTNHKFVNGSRADASMMLIDENSIYFSDSPFDWISGLCFSIGVVITMGSTLVAFPPKVAFEGRVVSTIIKTIEEEECTHAMMLAYLFHDITTCSEILDMKLSKLKVAITGGQATSIPLLKKVFDLIPQLTVTNCYGATEMNIVANQLLTKDNINTVDYGLMNVVDGFEIKIVDEKGKVVPLKTKGELYARGAWVSFSDWDLISVENKPTATGKNGWHSSNDGASLEGDGKLRLHGRLDDIIKCATESVPPYEIEDLLFGHPYVNKVCVVGVPDERLYEKLCACVILKDGKDSNKVGHLKNELDEYCSESCWESTMGLKWKPHYYVFLDEFPLTRTGKLSRRLVREIAVKKLGL